MANPRIEELPDDAENTVKQEEVDSSSDSGDEGEAGRSKRSIWKEAVKEVA